MSDVFRAMLFARTAHQSQRRKYTGNPYVDHLAEVAGIVATVDASETTMIVAWLHDCVEDQSVPLRLLVDTFGKTVADGVVLLSDLEIGNRAERKAASRERLAKAPWWVQNIKVADLISNTASIVQHDPSFAKVYLEEKRLLLNVLTNAHPGLVAIAMSQTNYPTD